MIIQGFVKCRLINAFSIIFICNKWRKAKYVGEKKL